MDIYCTYRSDLKESLASSSVLPLNSGPNLMRTLVEVEVMKGARDKKLLINGYDGTIEGGELRKCYQCGQNLSAINGREFVIQTDFQQSSRDINTKEKFKWARLMAEVLIMGSLSRTVSHLKVL